MTGLGRGRCNKPSIAALMLPSPPAMRMAWHLAVRAASRISDWVLVSMLATRSPKHRSLATIVASFFCEWVWEAGFDKMSICAGRQAHLGARFRFGASFLVLQIRYLVKKLPLPTIKST